MRELSVIFFSSWKFSAVFPVAIFALKMSFVETMLYTNIGGILGAIFFTQFFKVILRLWDKYWPDRLKFRKKTRRKFTRMNRWLVKMKTQYGLLGIVILSPAILSIPVGSFLVIKYYGLTARNIIYMIIGQVVWSLIFCFFYIPVSRIF